MAAGKADRRFNLLLLDYYLGGVPTSNPYLGAGGVRCHDNGVPPAGSPEGSVCAKIFSCGLRNPHSITQKSRTTKDTTRCALRSPRPIFESAHSLYCKPFFTRDINKCRKRKLCNLSTWDAKSNMVLYSSTPLRILSSPILSFRSHRQRPTSILSPSRASTSIYSPPC